jgi:carbonic anhydrase/acetyltransferase-like protein (isoleucine patch superfamily)
MAMIISLNGHTPQVAADAFVAPNAVLIGDVVIASGAGVWFGAVLRGDFNRIHVGAGSNVQDNAVIHTATDLPTTIGADVTIGHLAVLEGCTIEAGALIGMGCIILNRVRIGSRAIVAAGSVVKEGTVVPPSTLVAGVPAAVKRALTDEDALLGLRSSQEYQSLRLTYLAIR